MGCEETLWYGRSWRPTLCTNQNAYPNAPPLQEVKAQLDECKREAASLEKLQQEASLRAERAEAEAEEARRQTSQALSSAAALQNTIRKADAAAASAALQE
eukprot:8966273-Pyramimonas_sp.AAC.5